eukprot:TRINITY_DN659_c0_g1_i1.p2 TRINITY_DN659_c0_g1~~TRINITY_DN659_c0_g1_i1.p2  ORF type:complete len:101 (-),score=12.08 TRINITY_DN659_c0_g1_i1:321-623(-)
MEENLTCPESRAVDIPTIAVPTVIAPIAKHWVEVKRFLRSKREKKADQRTAEAYIIWVTLAAAMVRPMYCTLRPNTWMNGGIINFHFFNMSVPILESLEE